ncbi:hypothetical protein [Kineococcus indalonis]|uniref:hypothetical protein n=1 Tax=Kineococcus indalonis TaxID=2696566 RepID=UPI001411F747|nr:hypothetical protein [Kineococcus indalonis]NAZ86477.1 hypothetical protein [Kineococcus indalonis]
MGLGDGPDWRDDYEWFRLDDLPAEHDPDDGPDPFTDALRALVREYPVWSGTGGVTRVLLVDLDNLRAVRGRLRARLGVVVELARQADHVTLAGQVGAVQRSRPWLAEFARRAQPVQAGPDVADLVLLEAAAEVPGPAEYLVVSNDGIFADLAERGELTVLSPGVDALSDRLHGAASLLVDLADLEAQAAASV